MQDVSRVDRLSDLNRLAHSSCLLIVSRTEWNHWRGNPEELAGLDGWFEPYCDELGVEGSVG